MRSWGLCDKTCGGGVQSRSRQCVEPKHGGKACVGSATSTRAVDGELTAWTEWGVCSVTCGDGKETRTRECMGRVYRGKDCEGDLEENRICSHPPCPGNYALTVDGVWTEWTEWSECSDECGGGSKKRSRVCHGQAHGGKKCEGPVEENESCNDFTCPPRMS